MDCDSIEQILKETLLDFADVERFDLGCKIQMPQLNVDNDFLLFYLIEGRNGLELTDLGRTIEALNAESVYVETEKRDRILRNILRTCGLRMRGDELVMEIGSRATPNLKEKILLMSSAINGIHAMRYLREPRLVLDFRGMVREFLVEKEVPHRYTAPVRAAIVKEVTVDFLFEEIPVVIETLHAQQTYHASTVIDRTFFKFTHIGRIEGHHKRGVIYNDDSAIVESKDFVGLSGELDIEPIAWSDREEGLAELATISF